jgi:hypothetical protein
MKAFEAAMAWVTAHPDEVSKGAVYRTSEERLRELRAKR